ncbi:NAD(P)/FAD-dependent oxidoreductase [Tsukamurella sp. 8F]|uniref:NAD(P)/FAD-dependent oxidoreductase n=1 Tax=unclassified Tsukamurella TaxID=2633480 RepID=UPI0023B98CF1|nr:MULTISPECIES: NAD(P)/FAD-dependent oxidoreductase [unclassified Tsukamurella]MDF0529002.1 NAD(P)/FAD-dependent oxidoreductase [Tsukamurella sp. 8J]MDF0587375.1 NAD(P)/FAD-dependent oxidoreductase [Tsukamurella sp. 8F]
MNTDALVIGGGAAGLAAATTLARARLSVTVVDGGEPRNAPAEGVHAFLTRDGLAPAELVRIGREQLAQYGATTLDDAAVSTARDGERIAVTLASGTVVRTRRLLVASGVVDRLPDVDGLHEHWGKGVVHCPFCHGWEVRERPLVILATDGALAAHAGRLWRRWTDDLTVVRHTPGVLNAEQEQALAEAGVKVVDGPAVAIESDDAGVTAIRTADGAVPCAAVVVPTFVEARAGFLAGLGLEPEPLEMMGTVVGTRVATGPVGATAADGVWAAGNVADPFAQVVAAAAAGNQAAAAMVFSLAG